MNGDEALIEQVVRGVLRQLGASGGTVRGASNETTAETSVPAERPVLDGKPEAGGNDQNDHDVMPIAERVVTAEVLERQLGGRRAIRLHPKAVLTPSAREMLKKRAIAWERATGQKGSSQTSAGSTAWKVIVVQATAALDSALEDLGRQPHVALQRELTGDVGEAAALAIGAVCRGEAAGVLIATGQPEVAACLANRHGQVRAAVAHEVRSFEQIKPRLGPNVMCFGSEGRSWFELRNLLRAMTATKPKAPEGWGG